MNPEHLYIAFWIVVIILLFLLSREIGKIKAKVIALSTLILNLLKIDEEDKPSKKK